jgi:integrase/recombinase XerD
MGYEIKKENKQRRLPVVLSLEEFTKIMEVTKNQQHKLAFSLGFLCGLRISEVIKLKPDDIDYDRRLMFIREAKGGKDRYVPIPEQFTKRLKLLPIKIGIRALQFAFKRNVKKAGITKDVHFHTLRHSCATYYLSKGMNIVQVQQLLGHSNISTTTIYLHVSPDNVRESMDNIWNKGKND